MKKLNVSAWAALGFALLAPWAEKKAEACDLCAAYSASLAQGESVSGFHGGFAEQFTHFGTLKNDGHTVANEDGQTLNSSISQFFFVYNLNDQASLQLNLPVIHRTYRRMEDGAIAAGTETGAGDVTLLGKHAVYQATSEDYRFVATALGGLKLPTGSTARLREELGETEAPEGTQPSGIHGHDLALGTGSFDGIVGAETDLRWRRGLLHTSLQYSLRTEGRYGYHYANDLLWSAAPGYYLFLEHGYSGTLSFNLSGEFKGKDTFQGSQAEDTGITSVFAGPQVGMTVGERFSATLALDLPVLLDNTAFQIVPDSRIRAAVALQF